MDIVLAVAAVAFVLLVIVMIRRSRAGDRGDLLAPPPGLGQVPGPASSSDRARYLSDHVAAEARRLLAQDRKIEAIKRVRADLNCDLAQAKALVERMAPPDGGWPEGAAPIGDLPDQVAAEARRLVAQDRRIEAVKLVRAAMGCGLKEAMDWVERL